MHFGNDKPIVTFSSNSALTNRIMELSRRMEVLFPGIMYLIYSIDIQVSNETSAIYLCHCPKSIFRKFIIRIRVQKFDENTILFEFRKAVTYIAVIAYGFAISGHVKDRSITDDDLHNSFSLKDHDYLDILYSLAGSKAHYISFDRIYDEAIVYSVAYFYKQSMTFTGLDEESTHKYAIMLSNFFSNQYNQKVTYKKIYAMLFYISSPLYDFLTIST